MSTTDPSPSRHAPRECADAACFSVRAAADPGLMPRIVSQWAKRGLVPDRIHCVRCGPGDTELSIDLEARGISVDLSLQMAAELRGIWGVAQVLVARKTGAPTA